MAELKRQYERRLCKELADLQKRQPLGISVSLSEDNLHVWEALIPGPHDSLYKGGRFKVRITFPDDYPLKPPLIHFLTSIYHLNVSQTCGQVCLGFLSEDDWAPGATVEQILHALFSLLSRPEPANGFDHELLNKYHHYPGLYERSAKESARKAK